MKAFKMAERARRALPEVRSKVEVTSVGEGAHKIRLVLENLGFLPTSGLARGGQVGASPGVSARVELPDGMTTDDTTERQLEHLDGWGNLRTGSARHPIYAGLPMRGHRQFVEWTVWGEGTIEVSWQAGRGGRGVERVGCEGLE
jgi:hypothetical protein